MFQSELATLYTFEAYDSDGNGRVAFDGYMPSSFAISGAHTAREAVAQLGLGDYALFDNSISHAEAAYMTRESDWKTYYISTHYIKTDPAAFYFDEIYVKNLSLNYVEYRETFVSELGYVYLTDTKINQHFSANSPILLTALLNNSFIRQEGSSYINPVGYGSPLTSYGEPELSQWKNQFYYRYIGSDVTDEFTALRAETAQAISPDAQFYGNVVADLGDGNDHFTGSDRADIVYGGAGDDYIMAFYNPSLSNFERPLVPFDTPDGDYLDGGDGDDSIIGVSGGTMIGGAGYDFLNFNLHSETGRRIEMNLRDQLSAQLDVGYATFISGFEQFQMQIEDRSGQGTEIDARGFSVFQQEHASEYSHFNLVGTNDIFYVDHETSGNYEIQGLEKLVLDFSKSEVPITTDDLTMFSEGAGGETLLQKGMNIAGLRREDLWIAIYGTSGNDLIKLRGDTEYNGRDLLFGGAGNDTYYITPVSDAIREKDGEGLDTVILEHNSYRFDDIPYILPDHVENLALGQFLTEGYGNRLSNTIIGNDGDNHIGGAAGADILRGGGGSDTYDVDHVKDVVVETAVFGKDIVKSTVSYKASQNIEVLMLEGSKDINGYGGRFSDEIHGNAGKNLIDGGLGSDTLKGGRGQDTFSFSTKLKNSYDHIVDFYKDKILLDTTIFSKIDDVHRLSKSSFVYGEPAVDDLDYRINYEIYRSSAGSGGVLFYDPDGAGPKKAIVFATLSASELSPSVPVLSYRDFLLV